MSVKMLHTFLLCIIMCLLLWVFNGRSKFRSYVICGQSLVGSNPCGPPAYQILLPCQILSQYLLRFLSSGSDTIETADHQKFWSWDMVQKLSQIEKFLRIVVSDGLLTLSTRNVFFQHFWRSWPTRWSPVTEILHAVLNILKYYSQTDNVLEKVQLFCKKMCKYPAVSIEPPKNPNLLHYSAEQVKWSPLCLKMPKNE
jgi:hypothetical protein